MSGATGRLASGGFALAWSALPHVPAPVADRLFRAAADVAYRARGAGVVQYARNLLRVLGDQATPAALAAVTRAGVQSYARYWRETFQLPGRDFRALQPVLEAGSIGLEHIDRAQAQGRGTILALAHSGNWDVAGLMIAQRYGGLTVIVERLEPPSLFDKFVRFRESLGMEVIPLTGAGSPGSSNGANPSQLLRQRLAQGKVVALLADRDLSANGVRVTFFGEPTRMPAGPAMLAAITGADLCPAILSYPGEGWLNDIRAPLALPGARLRDRVQAGTQHMAAIFESGIAEHPADWHMMQPLWFTDLPKSHVARTSGK